MNVSTVTLSAYRRRCICYNHGLRVTFHNPVGIGL